MLYLKILSLRKECFVKFKFNAVLVCMFVFLICRSAVAGVAYNLEDFEDKGLNAGLSFIRQDNRNFAKVNLSPDLQLGPVGVGLDFNGYLPTDGGTVPAELQAVNLRMLSYDHNHIAGVKWGRLSHVTFGYGLLMDNYDSGSFGSREFNNQKAGVLGYGTISNIRVDGMWTASNVRAGRVSYTLSESFLLGSPIVFGANYVTDTDGIDRPIEGRTDRITRPIQSGVGGDIGLPIAGDFLTLYTEYAQLREQGAGSGAAAGMKGTFFGQADYRLEYRRLGAGFVPGFFNGLYEAVSAGPLPTTEANGVMGALGASVMDGYFKGDIVYEAYDGYDPVLTGAVGWKKVNNTVGVVNYSRAFGKGGAAVAQADVLYYTGGMFDYVVTYKRTYLDAFAFTESYSVGVRLNLNSLVPKLPFIM